MAAQRQMVRITSLAKTLDTLEKSTEGLIQESTVYKTLEEKEAFMKGFRIAFDLIRREYDIK